MKAAPCQTACGWVGTECKGCIALAEPGSPGRAGSAGAYDSFFGPAEQRGMRESLLAWLRGDPQSGCWGMAVKSRWEGFGDEAQRLLWSGPAPLRCKRSRRGAFPRAE